jgi:ribosomal protein S6--L-glutamate ligase
MCSALADEGVQSFVFSLSECLHDLQGGTVTIHGFDLCQLDAVVVKKLGPESNQASRLQLHLLRQLERAGVRIYSRPGAIDVAMDRYRMSMELLAAGLPMPATYSFESEAGLIEAAGRLGEAVVKPVYTSKARGMFRLGGKQSDSAGSDWPGGRGLIQQLIDAPGRDIGACVLNGSFAGAFYRVSAEGQWITSTSAGGTYARCTLPAGGVSIAEEAARTFRLDYTVVDLVETPDGYSIYEVSAFGGFRGLWEASAHDIARDYARYIKWDLLG